MAYQGGPYPGYPNQYPPPAPPPNGWPQVPQGQFPPQPYPQGYTGQPQPQYHPNQGPQYQPPPQGYPPNAPYPFPPSQPAPPQGWPPSQPPAPAPWPPANAPPAGPNVQGGPWPAQNVGYQTNPSQPQYPVQPQANVPFNPNQQQNQGYQNYTYGPQGGNPVPPPGPYYNQQTQQGPFPNPTQNSNPGQNQYTQITPTTNWSPTNPSSYTTSTFGSQGGQTGVAVQTDPSRNARPTQSGELQQFTTTESEFLGFENPTQQPSQSSYGQVSQPANTGRYSQKNV